MIKVIQRLKILGGFNAGSCSEPKQQLLCTLNSKNPWEIFVEPEIRTVVRNLA